MAQTSNSLLSPTKSMVALRPYMPPMCPFVPLCAMTFFHSDPMCPLRAPMCNDFFALRPYAPPMRPYTPPMHPYTSPTHPLRALHTPPMCLCAMTFLHSDSTCPLRASMCNDLFALRLYAPSTHPYTPPMRPLCTPYRCTLYAPLCAMVFLHSDPTRPLRALYVPPTHPLCAPMRPLRALYVPPTCPLCTPMCNDLFALRPYAPPMRPLRAPYAPSTCPYAPLCAMTFLHSDPMHPLRTPYVPPMRPLRAPYAPPMRLHAPYVPTRPLRAYVPPTCPLCAPNLFALDPYVLMCPLHAPNLFVLDPYAPTRFRAYAPTRLHAPAMQVPASILIG